jgi:hypothetical protein
MSIKRIDVIKEQLKSKDIKGISNIKDSGKGLIVNYGTGVSTYYRWAHFTDDNIVKDIIANSKGLGREWNIQEAKAKLCDTLYNKGYTADHFDGISNELHIIKESTGEQMKYKINFGSMKNWKQLEKTVKDIITAFEFGYGFPNYDEIYVQVTEAPVTVDISYFDLAYIRVWDEEKKRYYYIYYYRKAKNGARIYLRKDEVEGHEVEIAEKIKATMKGKYLILNYKGRKDEFLVQSDIGESAASILYEKDTVETLFGKKPMVAFVNNGVVIKRANK